MALQGRVSDALMNEAELAWTPVTALARAPILPGRPLTLEIRGRGGLSRGPGRRRSSRSSRSSPRTPIRSRSRIGSGWIRRRFDSPREPGRPCIAPGGSLIALAVVGVFVAGLGYGGYRVTRHLLGWSVAAQAKHDPMRINIDDATLRRVDVADSKVELASDLLGIFGATLVVTATTEIRMDDKPAQLRDLPAGARVRAAYEWRDGFKIASMIEAEAPPPTPVTR